MNSFQSILLVFTISSLIPSCICLGTWTWMYGEKAIDSSGTYGQMRVPNPSNIPRARDYDTSSFDRNSDTLWLFGGGSGSGKNKFENNN
jgi:hypothetical protein